MGRPKGSELVPYWRCKARDSNIDGFTSDFSPIWCIFEILHGFSRNPVLFLQCVWSGWTEMTSKAYKDNTTTDFMWWMIRISPYWLVRMVGQGPETNSDGLTSDFSPICCIFEILLGISWSPVLFLWSVWMYWTEVPCRDWEDELDNNQPGKAIVTGDVVTKVVIVKVKHMSS